MEVKEEAGETQEGDMTEIQMEVKEDKEKVKL